MIVHRIDIFLTPSSRSGLFQSSSLLSLSLSLCLSQSLSYTLPVSLYASGCVCVCVCVCVRMCWFFVDVMSVQVLCMNEVVCDIDLIEHDQLEPEPCLR